MPWDLETLFSFLKISVDSQHWRWRLATRGQLSDPSTARAFRHMCGRAHARQVGNSLVFSCLLTFSEAGSEAHVTSEANTPSLVTDKTLRASSESYQNMLKPYAMHAMHRAARFVSFFVRWF